MMEMMKTMERKGMIMLGKANVDGDDEDTEMVMMKIMVMMMRVAATTIS